MERRLLDGWATDMDLLPPAELPDRFTYPPEFLAQAADTEIDLSPWQLLEGDQLRWRNNGLRERYPLRRLVPFARRQDTDDIACWDVAAGDGMITVIHDFAEVGWETREGYRSYDEWLSQANMDHATFD